MKIRNVGSNMTELHTTLGAVVLFSYETPVAAENADGELFRTEERYSQTTTRHINKWLEGREARTVSQHVIDNFAL